MASTESWHIHTDLQVLALTEAGRLSQLPLDRISVSGVDPKSFRGLLLGMILFSLHFQARHGCHWRLQDASTLYSMTRTHNPELWPH